MKTTLVPYLAFAGNTEEVLNFYKEALDGEIVFLQRFKEAPMPVDEDWKDKIMHARLAFGGDCMLMLSDTPKAMEVSTNGNIQLSIQVEDDATCHKIFNKLAEGGSITMPLAVQFWGDLFGMLKDKYGMSWMVNSVSKK